MQEMIISRLKALFDEGKIDRVVGWKRGESPADVSPYVFESAESLKDFVYDDFCGANLSKFLTAQMRKEGKVAVVVKPCDSYSLNVLLKENRVERERVYVLGVYCDGKVDGEKLGDALSATREGDTLQVETLDGKKSIKRSEVLLGRCTVCDKESHAISDEVLGTPVNKPSADRFIGVEEIENMSEEERFEFWRGELSRCIRCNACRNACPACSCEKCIFDNDKSGVAAKANATSFEENMFHIIRAFHVSGRCTDCGECSRVCPQNIPLHLLNRKMIKDMNTYYGEYRAGEDTDSEHPLIHFTENDPEPSIVKEGK